MGNLHISNSCHLSEKAHVLVPWVMCTQFANIHVIGSAAATSESVSVTQPAPT